MSIAAKNWFEDPRSKTQNLFPPGGAIEAGESAENSAVRETLEETGYQVTLTGPGKTHAYDYLWDGRVVACETIFFPARLTEGAAPPLEVNDDSINKGIEWVERDRLAQVLSCHETIRQAVLGCLND